MQGKSPGILLTPHGAETADLRTIATGPDFMDKASLSLQKGTLPPPPPASTVVTRGDLRMGRAMSHFSGGQHRQRPYRPWELRLHRAAPSWGSVRTYFLHIYLRASTIHTYMGVLHRRVSKMRLDPGRRVMW